MKVIKRIKKGFTLVELVVVIAVIAILSGVGVGTYIAVTNNAKKSNDQQVLNQVNTCLMLHENLPGKSQPKTMQEVLDVLDAELGVSDVQKLLINTFSGYSFAWDDEADRFVILEGDKIALKDANYSKVLEGRKEHFWKMVATVDETADYGYSQYVTGTTYPEPGVVTVYSGLDVGNNSGIKKINYSSAASQKIIFRTNDEGTNIGINAPNADIYFYGSAGKILGVEDNAGAVVAPSSLHVGENANVICVKITKGHIENKGMIDLIYATSNDVQITNEGFIDHAHAPNNQDANTITNNSNGICFDYNENEEQNNNPDVYHHVIEGSEVSGEKPVTGTEAWNQANIEETINTTVDEISGYVVNVKYGTKEEKMKLSNFRDRWDAGEFVDNFVSATLTANVDISDVDWYPIGNWEYPFYGTFDGNGKTIKGLTAKSIDSEHQGLYSNGDTIGYGETYGLFGIIGGGDVKVSDLNLFDVDINIYNGKNVGALIGYVPSKANFSDEGKGGQYWSTSATGGKKVVPESFGIGDIEISDVSVSGSIIAASHVGGLVGKIYSTGEVSLNGCINSTDLTATGEGGLAGLVGYANGPSTILVRNSINLDGSSLKFDPSSPASGVMLADFVYSTTNSVLDCDETNVSAVTLLMPTEQSKKNIKQLIYACEQELTLDGYSLSYILFSRGNLIVKNTTVNGKTTNEGTMVIENSTLNGLDNRGTLTIKSGTFNKNITNTGSLLIKGGTYTVKPNANYLASGYISRLENGVWVVELGEWAVEDTKGEKYASLEEAINTLTNKMNPIKLTLLADVEEEQAIELKSGVSVDINLNGHDVSCTLVRKYKTVYSYANFRGDGTATLKSGTNIAKVYSTEQANIILEEGVTVIRPDNNTAVQVQNGTGTITIKGGTISGILSVDSTGKLIIQGGTFTVDPSAYVDLTMYDVIKNGSTWTVVPKK